MDFLETLNLSQCCRVLRASCFLSWREKWWAPKAHVCICACACHTFFYYAESRVRVRVKVNLSARPNKTNNYSGNGNKQPPLPRQHALVADVLIKTWIKPSAFRLYVSNILRSVSPPNELLKQQSLHHATAAVPISTRPAQPTPRLTQPSRAY